MSFVWEASLLLATSLVLNALPSAISYQFGVVDDFPRSEVLNEPSYRHQDVDVNVLQGHNNAGYDLLSSGAGGGGDAGSDVGGAPPAEGGIMQLEKKQKDLDGPVKLKVDDKNGLVKEGPYYDREDKNYSRVPKICDTGGVSCQRVDSRVTPRVKKGNRVHNRWRWDERRRRRKHILSREKRETPDDDDDDEEERKQRAKKCEHRAHIQAFGSNYTLCLFLRPFRSEPILSNSWAALNVTVFGARNASEDVAISNFDLKYATGFVLDEDFTSVTGFLMDDHFYGTVYMRDTVHYLEPHNRKSRDMHIFGDGLKTLLHKHDVRDSKEMKANLPGSADKGGGAARGDTPQRRICDLTIVSDHLFFSDVGEGSVEKTVLQMLWHIKEANALFQSKDFDNDGRSECIGFTVSEITIFKTADSAVNLLTGEYSVPEDFLKKFSRYNFDGFCLGVLFTNRAFSELVLGLSWRGNPKPDGVGGICQSRVRIKSDRNAYSFNALFISLKSSQEERIPLRMGVLNLVHEMMHSFGAKHDPDPSQNPACTPRDKWVNGRFLMSKYSNDGHKLNHEILSPCTKSLVVKNLASKTRIACLIKVNDAFCGDGIVQSGEDCDCGTIFQCIAARSCCVPPEGSGGKKPCSMQRDLTACVRGA